MLLKITTHSVVDGVGDYSSDSAGTGGGQQERMEGEGGGERGGDGEGGKEGEMDSILLFDEKTDSFQLFNEGDGKVNIYLRLFMARITIDFSCSKQQVLKREHRFSSLWSMFDRAHPHRAKRLADECAGSWHSTQRSGPSRP